MQFFYYGMMQWLYIHIHTHAPTQMNIKCITTDYGELYTHTLLDNRLLTIIIQYVFGDNINNYVLVKAPRKCVWKIQHEGGVSRDKYSTRRSRVLYLSRGTPRVLYFTHELRRCFNCYIAFLVLSGPIEPSQSSK